MKNLVVILFIIGVFMIQACDEKPETKKNNKTTEPPNIILIIGDGMGLSELSTSFYRADGEKSIFQSFPHVALMNTSSLTHKITDSGAAATAFATGERTRNGMISVDTNGAYLATIPEILVNYNYSSGVIATSSVTHATPAAFYAHHISRSKEEAIASQLHTSNLDFVAAGGYDFFSNRKDSLNYLDSLAAYNFIIDTTGTRIHGPFDATKKYAFLLSKNALPRAVDGRGDMLSESTQAALKYYQLKSNPFFLMIEGSQIDWAGHANNSTYLMTEMMDFEKSIRLALDYAKKDGNTIVIVTADHETGGFALAANDTLGYNHIVGKFATKSHTASLVPVLSFGPNTENLNGIINNTDLFKFIIRMSILKD